MRVVDAEAPNAAPAPAEHDVAKLRPQRLPLSRGEVDVVDVLVALGRVLGVLQRAIGAPVEPLGMRTEPRVVRRTLDREVDADLATDATADLDHRLELGHRPEVGMHGVMAALLAADRPRAARVAGLGDERVVPPLAVRDADRVDGREVDHVEAELGELRQHVGHALEAAPGAREQLVPAAESRALAVDVELERLGQRDRVLAVLRPQRGRRGPPLVGVALAEERSALGELARQLDLPARELAVVLVDPGRVRVGPGLDRELPPAEVGDVDVALPAIVAECHQLTLQPAARPGAPVAHDGPQLVVAVPEDRRRDEHTLAERRLRGIAPAVHLRVDVLDLDSGRRAV